MARKTIGILNVKLTANAAGFSRVLRAARSDLNRFATFVGTKVIGIGGGIAAAFLSFRAISSVIRNFRDAFGRVDEIAKMSAALGVSVQTLEAWQRAAQLTGSDADTFRKALGRMSKNIGDAKIKSSEAKDAIEALGLDLAEVAGLTTEDQLLAIAGSFNKLKTTSEKASVAAALFGREGIKLINLLSEGRSGLERYIDEWKKFGGITTEGAKKIEMANDALTDLRLLIHNAYNSLAELLSPAIIEISTLIKQWAIDTGALRSVVRSTMTNIVFIIAAATELITKHNPFQVLRQSASLFVDAVDTVTKAIPGGDKMMDTILSLFDRNMEDLKFAQGLLNQTIDARAITVEEVLKWFTEITKKYDEIAKSKTGMFSKDLEDLEEIQRTLDRGGFGLKDPKELDINKTSGRWRGWQGNQFTKVESTLKDIYAELRGHTPLLRSLVTEGGLA